MNATTYKAKKYRVVTIDDGVRKVAYFTSSEAAIDKAAAFDGYARIERRDTYGDWQIIKGRD
jgi:hypothetical protein